MEFTFIVLATRVVRRVVVHIRKEYCLRKWWFDVFARAAVTVTASTYLKGRVIEYIIWGDAKDLHTL